MIKSLNFVVLLSAITVTLVLSFGCSPKSSSNESANQSLTQTMLRVGSISDDPSLSSLRFEVPENIGKLFKRKCYVCHGGPTIEGNFDLKKMIYRVDENSDWLAMDLAGVTQIKLAILPINGETPRMPKRAGSVLNPLTQQEANTIAQWTDFPYQR